MPEVGMMVGRLKVIEKLDKRDASKNILWRCVCTCDLGKEVVVPATILNLKRKQSCGCLIIEHIKKVQPSAADVRRKTGIAGGPTYTSWYGMICRCESPKHKHYQRYGGSGITVCDRWREEEGFVNFISDMGLRPEGKTLDRIDNSLGYFKENCRWATRKEQQRNRRCNVLVEIDGVTKCLKEWSEFSGVHPSTLRQRYNRGVSGKELLAKPKRS